jgi:hypothetical protein
MATHSWVIGEFDSPETIIAGARKMRELGYRGMDAYTPYPIPELIKALAIPKSWVPLLVLIGGLSGAAGGFLLATFCNFVDWPINVGGRPPLSWPSFIPVTFECGVLAGALTSFFGSLALMGFPRPYFPAFEVEAFRSATIDKFWLGCPMTAAELETKNVVQDLSSVGAHHVSTVAEAS